MGEKVKISVKLIKIPSLWWRYFFYDGDALQLTTSFRGDFHGWSGSTGGEAASRRQRPQNEVVA
ncbi:hypothetical protein, partial [Bacillus paralicheniformis]|uniref:hypothetical protein n=1 Tax=Bacillus paralicheniformis TaxID=1648923 RepID=UPI001F45A5DA